MNYWIQKSIELANAPRYLDKLHVIYPVNQEKERKIPVEVKNNLRIVFDEGDNQSLVKELLKLPKFPVKDPYVAFLRKNTQFINYNPYTINRIAKRVREMGFDTMIKSIEEPKEFNRQIGTLFKNWITELGYPLEPADNFKAHRGITIVKGSDSQLKSFANNVLKCNLDKGPDFIAKVGDNYVIGEAKFLTDYGGHQNAQFSDALRLLKNEEGNAIRIAILDGVVWIKNNTKMYRTIAQLKGIALSSLLLKDFLQDLLKNPLRYKKRE